MHSQPDTKGSFTDHPRKQVIRAQWCKILLNHIYNTVGKKFLYLGLPGIKALDIKEWISYIDDIIAFQCNNYDTRGELISDEISELVDELNTFKRKGQIKNWALFEGYMEEVIMTGLDENANQFIQKDYITVYNLDFCNTLTNPYEVADVSGNKKRYYKLDVINKLLETQKQLISNSTSNKFIMFLTVNSNFWESEMTNIEDAVINKYLKKLEKIKGKSKDIRLLKAYAFHFISKHFKKNKFNIEILPPIYYEGSGGYHIQGKFEPHYLITFTILGTTSITNPPSFQQDVEEFLMKKLIFATNSQISCFEDKKFKIIEETHFDANPEKIFLESFTYLNLWK